MASLMRIGYLVLLLASAARASIHGVVTSACIARSLFCCLVWVSSAFCCSIVGSLDQSDLVRLTMTRVPSLLIATVSDRLTKARSCESPVAGAVAPSEGNMTANELSTWVECIIRKKNWVSKPDLLLLLQRCFTTPMALTCTMSAMTSPRSSHTPLATIRSIVPALLSAVRLRTD